jgi:hypothetical protein
VKGGSSFVGGINEADWHLLLLSDGRSICDRLLLRGVSQITFMRQLWRIVTRLMAVFARQLNFRMSCWNPSQVKKVFDMVSLVSIELLKRALCVEVARYPSNLPHTLVRTTE